MHFKPTTHAIKHKKATFIGGKEPSRLGNTRVLSDEAENLIELYLLS